MLDLPKCYDIWIWKHFKSLKNEKNNENIGYIVI
jgi:hypothetical protein